MESNALINHHDWNKKGYQAPYEFICSLVFPEPFGVTASLSQIEADRRKIEEVISKAKALGVELHQCYVCGQHLKYNYVVQDATGKNFVVGCDCVEKIGDTRLMTTIQIEHERARKNADRQRKISKEMRRKLDNELAWLSENPTLADAFDFCKNNESAWHVSRDIARKVGEFGSISEKQVAVLVREYDKHLNPPKQEEVVEVPVGKQIITGEVLSFKWVDSYTGYGHGSLKFLVKDDRGFKVFGTCPSSLSEAVKGSRVTFTAILQPTKDFGFAFSSHPSKGTVLSSPSEIEDTTEEIEGEL